MLSTVPLCNFIQQRHEELGNAHTKLYKMNLIQTHAIIETFKSQLKQMNEQINTNL